LGFPALGFNGAAYASIIAELAGLMSIALILRYNNTIKKLHLFKNWKFSLANTKLIAIQSAPIVLQYAISVMSWEFFYILIEHHGDRDLAISNIMRNIFGFFGCFTWAFAATTNSMVSNIIGQGLQHRVFELIHKIVWLSLTFSLTVCLLLNIFPHIFLSMYQQNHEFMEAAIPVIRVVSIAMVLMSVSVVWLNSLIGTGSAKINLLIEIMAIIIYCVYVYTVLESWQKPITWGWASEWLYWTAMLIPSYLYMKSGRWKNRKI
jgi:Na+-driven multidrug efflux pump